MATSTFVPGRLRMGVAVLLGAFTLMVWVGGAIAATRRPMDEAQELMNKALKILADKQTPLVERQRQLRDLATGHFDFAHMARSAMGPHWRDLPAQKRADFVKLFTAFIEDAYLNKIDDYTGQQVRYVREVDHGDGQAEVQTQIVQEGKEPIPVNYMLEDQNGDWKVYDVTVDNISVIANYRTQFNRVINNDGLDKLMADMRNKQQELAARLGTGHSNE